MMIGVDLEPGDVLDQAMIGPPVGGLVDLLIGTEHVLWQPDDPMGLAERVGFGSVARTLREADRYREVVMVAPDRSSILVVPRLTSTDGAYEARSFGGAVVDAEERREHIVSNEVWDDFGRWLTNVFVAASTRSEFIVVEKNTPEFADEPYALAIVMTSSDPAIIHLECNPRPDGAAMWPPGNVPEGQTISAPLDRPSLDVAGPMIADAVRTWSDSAHEVAVTFCTVGQPPLVLTEL
jgi:hypothetical protein